MTDKVTPEKLAKYFKVSQKALSIAKDSKAAGKEKDADIILDMAERYIRNAKHFQEKGDIVTSFAALNYCHGWLDCGAMLGILNVDDNTLFTVD